MKRKRLAAFLLMTALLALIFCGCGETQDTRQVKVSVRKETNTIHEKGAM